ncbi:hypothetical protein E2C01_093264 [Portunus trituberculatus]|uniref:Uncharacterized protein n=1 Tax=Portunus trituberculatus TaxID=210409 RepID=A0A5B7JMA4_PORTR|nr:hypothetical protein [Portunus trituberculatus]
MLLMCSPEVLKHQHMLRADRRFWRGGIRAPYGNDERVRGGMGGKAASMRAEEEGRRHAGMEKVQVRVAGLRGMVQDGEKEGKTAQGSYPERTGGSNPLTS